LTSPLRDNDAIDPLSGCHEITQWFVTDIPYSGERLTPAFDIAPSGHGISLKFAPAVVSNPTEGAMAVARTVTLSGRIGLKTCALIVRSHFFARSAQASN